MAPTVSSGAYVLAIRARNVSRGDIVTFRYPREPRTTFIKRVVASGGDTVEIRAKKLLVNGKAVHEPYVAHGDPQIWAGELLPEPYRSRDHFGPYVVPTDPFFVMGDNRDASSDSRYWGAVPRANVVGRVLWVADENRNP
jgi:signal peptidase I